MTDMSLTELIDPVNELVQADIFADDGGQLAFRHDITREAVRGSLLPPVRRAIDRQAAEVLLARGALPVEVATQLVESAEPGDDTAIETALAAAQALGASDPAAAAELAAKALDLTPLRHKRTPRTRAAWTRQGLAALGLDSVPARTNQDQRDAIAAAMTARQHNLALTETMGDIVVPTSRWWRGSPGSAAGAARPCRIAARAERMVMP
jgi:hypothetical protein